MFNRNQQSIAYLVLGVDVSSIAEQKLHDIKMMEFASKCQRCVSTLIVSHMSRTKLFIKLFQKKQ
jgi:hypothetical protein